MGAVIPRDQMPTVDCEDEALRRSARPEKQQAGLRLTRCRA